MSAKNNINVEQAFQTLTENALARRKIHLSELRESIVLDQKYENERSSCKC
jgi:RNase P/RNase MRP subunit p30